MQQMQQQMQQMKMKKHLKMQAATNLKCVGNKDTN